MVQKGISFGKSAKILIEGDEEKITVTLYRFSKIFSQTEINKHPGFFETIFPACSEKTLFAIRFSEDAKEELFRERIERSIQIKIEIANMFVADDKKLEQRVAEKRKNYEQKHMKLDSFIDAVSPKGNTNTSNDNE